MKFVFVVGGTYKSFYLNELNKIKNASFVVFYHNIFYDFNYEQEIFKDAQVSNELIFLNKKLKCPIVVCGVLNKDGIRRKCFIVCNKGKIKLINYLHDIYLYINKKLILIGSKIYNNSNAFATISIAEKKYNNESNLKYKNNYFIFNKKNVTLITKHKVYKKFRKCCYFILSFSKKVI